MPKRVRVEQQRQRDAAPAGPTTIRNRSYCGIARPKTSTAPAKPGARGPSRSSAPQSASAASRTISTTPNVAVELQQLGRRRRGASAAAPRSARRAPRPRARRAARRPRSRQRPAAQRCASASPSTRRYAPSMYSEPCAKLTMRVTPKISVRPAATRNSADATARPLRSWTTKRGERHCGSDGANARRSAAYCAAGASIRRAHRARRRRRAGSPCRRRSASRPSRPCRPSPRCGRRTRPSSTGGRARGT